MEQALIDWRKDRQVEITASMKVLGKEQAGVLLEGRESQCGRSRVREGKE